jgi:RNA recognition motif-containing protein
VLQRRGKTIVYAFITFEAEADAKKAIGDLNETELDGNKIVVEVARPIDEEVLTQRKENRKQNRKLKRQVKSVCKSIFALLDSSLFFFFFFKKGAAAGQEGRSRRQKGRWRQQERRG